MTRKRPTAGSEWYADGLSFECTQCGNCCTGPPGYVWVTEDEMAAMAKSMQLDAATFRKQYARRERGGWSLKEHLTEHGYDCIFLDRVSRPGLAGCSIYKTRPTQCRTWPFWPENLESPEAWERTKRVTPCPGMDTGTVVPLTQITIQRDRHAEDE